MVSRLLPRAFLFSMIAHIALFVLLVLLIPKPQLLPEPTFVVTVEFAHNPRQHTQIRQNPDTGGVLRSQSDSIPAQTKPVNAESRPSISEQLIRETVQSGIPVPNTPSIKESIPIVTEESDDSVTVDKTGRSRKKPVNEPETVVDPDRHSGEDDTLGEIDTSIHDTTPTDDTIDNGQSSDPEFSGNEWNGKPRKVLNWSKIKTSIENELQVEFAGRGIGYAYRARIVFSPAGDAQTVVQLESSGESGVDSIFYRNLKQLRVEAVSSKRTDELEHTFTVSVN